MFYIIEDEENLKSNAHSSSQVVRTHAFSINKHTTHQQFVSKVVENGVVPDFSFSEFDMVDYV